MTSEGRVVALDRPQPGDAASRGGDLLDVTFGWADFTWLRRLVADRCAAAGLSGSRLDDFVLAVHEITANAIMHAGTNGRLILRRGANGLRCLICDHAPEDPAAPSRPVPGGPVPSGPVPSGPVPSGPVPRARASSQPCEPAGAESGRGLWLAAQLADELSITSGPDGMIVSLFARFT